MPFPVSQILDHGTENPIVARLALQIFDIIKMCNITEEAGDGIMGIYMNSLVKKLLRCWEIRERYSLEFNRQVASYKPPAAQSMVVNVPSVPRLEEECHNFLYEAKNFVRDLLKAVNLLYGTQFTEASEYYPAKGKRKSKSLVEFAEVTFGSNDPKTAFLRNASPGVEYLVSLRNAVEHPDGHSGILKIRNFQLERDGKVSEPCWWRVVKGKNTPESLIRKDLDGAIHHLLTLGENIFVFWAKQSLKFPDFTRIALVPKKERDPIRPVKYVVIASEELLQRIANSQEQQR
jgi:hypothetical protein